MYVNNYQCHTLWQISEKGSHSVKRNGLVCRLTFRRHIISIYIALITSSSRFLHHSDVIKGAMASQITSITMVCSTVYSGADQRKHQSSASLIFGRGIHRWPVNFQHKGPVRRKMFPFDDVIIEYRFLVSFCHQGVASGNIDKLLFIYWTVFRS